MLAFVGFPIAEGEVKNAVAVDVDAETAIEVVVAVLVLIAKELGLESEVLLAVSWLKTELR